MSVNPEELEEKIAERRTPEGVLSRWKVRTAGLIPDIERARQHIIQNIDRYFKASDFLGRGSKWLKALKQVQPPPSLFSFLHYERGLPREYVPYPVAWGRGDAERLFREMGRWNNLASIVDAIAVATGVVYTKEEVLRWLYGKEMPPEVREWLISREEGGLSNTPPKRREV